MLISIHDLHQDLNFLKRRFDHLESDQDKRLSTLESQVTELVTLLDTLTEKLIDAGILVKRKGK